VKINSEQIKTVLMYYYRFNRQYIACDEVASFGREIADVLIDTGKYFIEIEIKTNKADLCQEKKKIKHSKSLDAKTTLIERSKYSNKYYLCVPEDLKDYALNWIQEINPKYGLIVFNERYFFQCKYPMMWGGCLWFVKNGSKFHNNYSEYLKRKISKRLSSALTNEYARKILKEKIKRSYFLRH
jgi:hypothetical protein